MGLVSLANLQQIDGINASQGLTNCMDDEELYLSIITMYVEQVEEYLPQLIKAVSDNNLTDYGNLAHSIKGASASVGAETVQQLAAQLEQAGKQQNTSEIEQHHEQFMALLNSTCQNIKGAL